VITVNDVEVDNESPATWVEGRNEVVITVTNGDAETVYTVIVTKTNGD
jgi:7-cyano-7-deazaguanine synthase in queuosine biosynthesis